MRHCGLQSVKAHGMDVFVENNFLAINSLVFINIILMIHLYTDTVANTPLYTQ